MKDEEAKHVCVYMQVCVSILLYVCMAVYTDVCKVYIYTLMYVNRCVSVCVVCTCV